MKKQCDFFVFNIKNVFSRALFGSNFVPNSVFIREKIINFAGCNRRQAEEPSAGTPYDYNT